MTTRITRPGQWSISRLTLIGLNLLVYYLLLRWAGENIDLGRVAGYLRAISAWAILGSLAIYMATLGLYGVRMALLLERDFRSSLAIVSLGYALNSVIPLRLGEALKVFLAHRLYRIPLTALLSASVAEKLFDVFKLLLLAGIVAIFSAGDFTHVGAVFPILALASAAAAIIALARIYIVPIVRLFPKGSRLRRISIELHKHAGAYPLGRILVVTAAMWLLNVGIVYFSFNTYLPGISLGVMEAATLFLILALTVAIPSAPGAFGLFEAVVVAYLARSAGVVSDAALAAAAVFHLVISLPPLVLTGLLLLRSGFVASPVGDRNACEIDGRVR